MKSKIYTRKGDKGKTSFYNGKKVVKSHLRLNAYGTIDELNSLLGIIVTKLGDKRAELFISQVQKDLFLIGASLAGASQKQLGVLSKRVVEMEKVIDKLDSKLPGLSHFILPEGIEPATLLFFTRAVTRRAERELAALTQKEPVDEKILVYLNRLSDLFFVLARYLNFKAGVIETVWKKPI